MHHIFEQAISNVNSAYPSIYTKEDVLRLIQYIRVGVEAVEKEKSTVSNDILEAIKESLLEGVKNLDLADFVTLELNYNNQIDIDVDTRAIQNEIEECFDVAVSEVMPAPTEK